MKKRLFKTLACAALAASMLFTACGSGSSDAPQKTPTQNTPSTDKPVVDAGPNFTVPAGGYDGSEVNITFYHTMGQTLKPILEEYIAEFNKLYPNIHVTNESVGGYPDVRDQISTELTVGNEPNIAYCYPDHVALYNLAGAVAHLDTLIASKETVTRADGSTETLGLTDAQIKDFIPGYYAEGTSFGDDHMYTMPFSKSTEVLYYNKTFFDENGLEVPKTWDEMGTLLEVIKDIDPESVPLGYDSEANWFITMCEQYGSPYTSATGDHFLFNNEQNKAFVKTFREWYQNDYLTTQQLYGAYTSGLFIAETGQRSYMSIGSSAGATHQRPAKNNSGEYPFEVGIASIPQVDPSNPKVISQGPSVCIFKKDNPQEVIASWLLVKFLTTNVEFQASFSMESGYVPVISSVAQNPIYADHLSKANGGSNISALAAKVCLEQQDAYYVSPAFNGSSKARDQVGDLMQTCFLIKDNVDQEIDKAFEKAINNCLY